MEILIPEQYRKTREEIEKMWTYIHNIDISPEILLMIDYAYHSEDENYGDGLSFLDRLYKKLSLFFEINWEVEHLKILIRNSQNPSSEFVVLLNELLTEDMIQCYGV
jgi:chromatin remodeling complex protein RSC6